MVTNVSNSNVKEFRKFCSKHTINLATAYRTAILYQVSSFKMSPEHAKAFWLYYGMSGSQYTSLINILKPKTIHFSEVVATMMLLEACMIHPPSHMDLNHMASSIIKSVVRQYKKEYEAKSIILTRHRLAFLFEIITGMSPFQYYKTEWENDMPGGVRRAFKTAAAIKGGDNSHTPRFREDRRVRYPASMVTRQVGYEDNWSKLTKLVDEAKKNADNIISN